MVSSDELKKWLTSLEGEAEKGVEERELLGVKLCEARLRLEVIENWEILITDAD